MRFIEQCALCFSQLSDNLGIDHLSLDAQGRCALSFQDEFEIEIKCLHMGAIELHGYLLSCQLFENIPTLIPELLYWNCENQEFGAVHIGLHRESDTITLNGFVQIDCIDAVKLENIMNNFIDQCRQVQQWLMEMLLDNTRALYQSESYTHHTANKV